MSSVPSNDDPTVLRAHGDVIQPSGPPDGATPARPPSTASGGNALPVGTRLSEFEILGILGEGGFGIVYTAQDHSLGRRVALREYMPASLASRMDSSRVQVRSERHRETFDLGLRSFVNEARLLAQFDHPSLVKVYRFWEANGTAYMVMPLYDGVTLKDTLRRLRTPPDEAWLMNLLAPLTEALSVIHADHCYHRDIAPDNIILLAGSERPLLLDFGAARRVISDMTQALTVILKPGYAPVEQYAEVPDMKQGPWTDIYALAATVYYAMVGKTPPPSVGRLMKDSFEPVASLAAGRYSDRFLRAIDHALQLRPADRTPTIAAFRQELGLPPVEGRRTASASTPVAAAPAPARASKGLLIGGGVAAVAVAGIAAFMLSGSPRSGSEPAAAGPGSLAAPPGVASQATATAPTPAPSPPSTGTTAVTTDARAPGAPPAAAPKAFEIRDEFDKVLASQTAGFKVVAEPVKATLRIGRDKLGFKVTSSRDGYVNVLVLGPDGSLLLLFPNGRSSDNRIKAGQTLTLPQPSWLLDTAEPAGREDFLVIVSDEPRDYSELSKEREYMFLKLPTDKRGAELAAGWTRGTPLLLGGVKRCQTPDCEAYGAATFSADVVH
jgi:serine/threonine protein kinase